MGEAWAAVIGAVVGGGLTALAAVAFAWREERRRRRVAARLALAEAERVRVMVDESLKRGIWWPPLDLQMGPEVLAPLAGLPGDDWERVIALRTSVYAIESLRENFPPGPIPEDQRRDLSGVPAHIRRSEAVLARWAGPGEAPRQFHSSRELP